jgi:formiminotetrahydrofolate cyclodeaminase
MLVDEPLGDLIAELASPNPTPGGGSAAAVASAMGAALLVMVASLPKTRSGTEDDRAALAAARSALTAIQHQLTGAIDADSAAYDQVVTAYKQPKATEAERAGRAAAIQRALRGATDVPLGVMRLSHDALKQAATVAAHGHVAADSDARVAVALLRTALEGARWNAESNIEGIADAQYVDAVRSECRRLGGDAAAAANEANRLLGLRRVR